MLSSAFRLHKFSFFLTDVMNELVVFEADKYYEDKGRRGDLLPRVLDPEMEAERSRRLQWASSHLYKLVKKEFYPYAYSEHGPYTLDEADEVFFGKPSLLKCPNEKCDYSFLQYSHKVSYKCAHYLSKLHECEVVCQYCGEDISNKNVYHHILTSSRCGVRPNPCLLIDRPWSPPSSLPSPPLSSNLRTLCLRLCSFPTLGLDPTFHVLNLFVSVVLCT